MELISDALLIAGAVGAAAYCRILAKRLGALKELDSGLGAAIGALSRQVDELRGSLDAAKSVSGDKAREIAQMTARAEMAAGRLELLLASLHENGAQKPVSRRADRAAERAAGLMAAAREDAARFPAEFDDEEDANEAAFLGRAHRAARVAERRDERHDERRTDFRPDFGEAPDWAARE